MEKILVVVNVDYTVSKQHNIKIYKIKMTITNMVKIKGKGKKGISPVIATVLLIAMVIVIGLIIFLWAKGFQGEAITKNLGSGEAQNVEIVCREVSFEADYSSPTLFLSNLGNIPIFDIQAKIFGEGEHETISLGSLSGWPETGLSQGATYSRNLDSEFSGANTVLLIPALRGTSNSGERIHICDDQFGKEILV